MKATCPLCGNINILPMGIETSETELCLECQKKLEGRKQYEAAKEANEKSEREAN